MLWECRHFFNKEKIYLKTSRVEGTNLLPQICKAKESLSRIGFQNYHSISTFWIFKGTNGNSNDEVKETKRGERKTM